MWKVWGAAVVLLVSGCVWTGSYGPYSYWGRNDSGYMDTQLAEDHWMVTYRGNSMTDPAKVVDFTLLRAAELATESGFAYFMILGVADGTRTSAIVAPGSTTATSAATVTCSGASAVLCSGSGSTVYRTIPPTLYQIVRPGLSIQVMGLKEEPAGGAAFDARFITESIRHKHGLR